MTHMHTSILRVASLTSSYEWSQHTEQQHTVHANMHVFDVVHIFLWPILAANLDICPLGLKRRIWWQS